MTNTFLSTFSSIFNHFNSAWKKSNRNEKSSSPAVLNELYDCSSSLNFNNAHKGIFFDFFSSFQSFSVKWNVSNRSRSRFWDIMDAIFFEHCSPFQLQITASIRERPLRATWATIAVPTLPTAAVRGPTLLFVTERGLCGGPPKRYFETRWAEPPWK